ncbi:hypothetical protein WJX73_008539 [Symbiochloris irregularis]|uniref:Uncharacterized protein n=1 Tax=Symbiochloris irregularis TaxID=706552 RepID=A0AAW1PX85_9CHLO
MTGMWKKDKGHSDSMEEACNIMQLPWVFRKAVLILNTVQIEDTDESFRTAAKVAGIIDLVEHYPWEQWVKHPRRDKRRGQHTGRVHRSDHGATIEYSWPPPLGGSGTDDYTLSEDGRTLTVTTSMHIPSIDRRCSYRTVYHRA